MRSRLIFFEIYSARLIFHLSLVSIAIFHVLRLKVKRKGLANVPVRWILKFLEKKSLGMDTFVREKLQVRMASLKKQGIPDLPSRKQYKLEWVQHLKLTS